jgi:DNA-binding transcriptional regulator YbjK
LTKQLPLGEARRDAIADAAIRLVATQGLRGLTHRGVDVAAGLPPGSTSYYLRTRKALLTACLDRMLALDAGTVVPSDHRAAPLDLLVETVLQLSREQPERQVARYELALEATRQPEIRAVMDHHARQLRLVLARMLAHGGIRDPDEASWPVAAMVDGLLRDRVTGLGATLTDAAFEASARRALSALLRGLCLPED